MQRNLRFALRLLAGAILGLFSGVCFAAGDRNIDTNVVYPAGALLQNGGRVINMQNPPAGIRTAAGDGVTDDTGAFQDAYNYIKNQFVASGGASSYIIYIPNGTYRVTQSLIYTGSAVTGNDINNLRLVGQSREGTIIRLDSNLAAFQSKTNPAAVIYFQHPSTTFNNIATQNLCENLTVNTGSGNPGAAGIQFQGANSALMANVLITSMDGGGAYGIWLEIGSVQAYLKDITINGFDDAVYSYPSTENDAALEHLTCTNQHVAAISIVGGGVSVRDMLSNQSAYQVPAVVFSQTGGSCVLVDSQLNGGGSVSPAVVITGTEQDFFGRNTTVSGYTVAVRKSGTTAVAGPFISEYCDYPVTTLFPGQDFHSYALAVQDTPETPWETNLSNWLNVEDYRSAGSDDATVTAALAAAGSNGSTVVYFPHLTYNLTSAMTIPACVTRMDFMFCNPGNTSAFFVTTSSTTPLTIFGKEGYTSVLIYAPRTIVAQLVSGNVNNQQSAPVSLFSESCANQGAGNKFCTTNEHVWARCLNDENVGGTDMMTSGGTLWIFGSKTENKVTISLSATGGGVAEMLGGYVNTTVNPGAIPMISNTNSSICYTGFTNMSAAVTYMIREVRGATAVTAGVGQFPKRGAVYSNNILVPLYVGGARPSGPFGQFQRNTDVGSVAAAGAAINCTGNTFFVDGAGAGMGGVADAFQFVNTSWTGDGTIVALINSVDNTNAAANGGVMFRDSTNANGIFVDMAATPSQGICMQARTSVGGAAVTTGSNGSLVPPYWVKLQRSGTTTFTGSVSSDGNTWTQLGTAAASMPSSAYAGLCVSAGSTSGTLCRSIMSNVAMLTGVPSGLIATSGSGQIGLVWNTTPYATAYNVKRATGSNGPFTIIASPSSASYTDTNVNSTTVYYYVVSAVNQGGVSADSNSVSATVILSALQYWRLTNFNTLNLNDPYGGDTVDPSGEGIPNLLRYALGLPAIGTIGAGLPFWGMSGSYLTLSFTRCKVATDITYHILESDDLDTWNEIWNSQSVPYGGGANPEQTVSVSGTFPISNTSGEKEFLRLEITDP